MNFFYSEDINENYKEIFLRDQEHTHLVKSLRFDINETVFITDGKGNKYETKLVEKERNKLSFQVEEDVREVMGSIVYKTIIPRNIKISESPSHGKPVLLYDHNCIGFPCCNLNQHFSWKTVLLLS